MTPKRLLLFCLIFSCYSVRSQLVINSLSQNGQITWSGTSTGDVVCVQWAPTAAGPWYSSWDELCSIVVTSTVNRAEVPMFYRILKNTGLPANIADKLTDRTSANVNPQAIRFVPPAGDGRGHRAGVMLKGNSLFDAFGSTWEFDYQRDDWGVQVIHPFKTGQCIFTIHRNSLGLSTPARWLEIGYGTGTMSNLVHTTAYTNIFPLVSGTSYHIKTAVTPGGGVSVLLNGSLVATGTVTMANQIDFNVGTNETYQGQSVWDVREFTGANFPLVWQKGYSGVILEPVDTGSNRLSTIKYFPGF
jgi:hypothetical protein